MRENNKNLWNHILKQVTQNGDEAFRSKRVKKAIAQYQGKCEPVVQPYNNLPGLINFWLHAKDEYGESLKHVWFFENIGEDKVREALWKYGVPVDGYFINSAYDCTGRRFYYPIEIHSFAERIIVTQSSGLDI